MGEWRYSSTILDIVTRWRWVVTFTPRPHYPRGESLRYPLSTRLSGLQGRSGRCGEESNPSSAARSPSLYRMSYADAPQGPRSTNTPPWWRCRETMRSCGGEINILQIQFLKLPNTMSALRFVQISRTGLWLGLDTHARLSILSLSVKNLLLVSKQGY
jgi:hypothetical protein